MREPSANEISYEREVQARPKLDKHRKGIRTMDTGIRSQIGTEANRRYLRELPIFRIDTQLPDRLNGLLEAIDRKEREGSARRD